MSTSSVQRHEATRRQAQALRHFVRRKAMALPTSVRRYAAEKAGEFGLTPHAFLTETLRIIAHDDMAMAILGDLYRRELTR